MNYGGTGDGTSAKSKLTDEQKRALHAFNLRALQIPSEEYAKIANTMRTLRNGDNIAYVPADAKLVVEKGLRKDYIEALKVLKANSCPRLPNSDYATFKGVITKAHEALRAKRKTDEDPNGAAAAGGGGGGDAAGKKKRKKKEAQQTKQLMLEVSALKQRLQELQSAPGGNVSAVQGETSERQGAAERKVTFESASTENESTAGISWTDFLSLTDHKPEATLEAAAMDVSEQTDDMDLYATSEELIPADESVHSNGTMAAVQPVDNGLNPTSEQLQHVEDQLQHGDLQLSIHDLDGHDGSDEFRHGLDAKNRKLSKIQPPKTIKRARKQRWGTYSSTGRAGTALAMALAPAGAQALEFPPRKVQQLMALAAGLLIVVGMLGVVVMGLRAHRMARGRGLLIGMALLIAAAFNTAVAATNRFQLLRPVEVQSPSPPADTAGGQVEHASGGGRTSPWWLLGIIVVMLIVTVFVQAAGRHYEAVRVQVRSEGPRSYTQFAAQQEIFDIEANLSYCPDMASLEGTDYSPAGGLNYSSHVITVSGPPAASASPGSPSSRSSEESSAKTDDVEAPVQGCAGPQASAG